MSAWPRRASCRRRARSRSRARRCSRRWTAASPDPTTPTRGPNDRYRTAPSSRRPDSTWPGNWTSGAVTAGARKPHRPSCWPRRTSRYGVIATLVADVGRAYLTLRALDLNARDLQSHGRLQKAVAGLGATPGWTAASPGSSTCARPRHCCTRATKTIPEVERQIEQTGKLHQHSARPESWTRQTWTSARPADRGTVTAAGTARPNC